MNLDLMSMHAGTSIHTHKVELNNYNFSVNNLHTLPQGQNGSLGETRACIVRFALFLTICHG